MFVDILAGTTPKQYATKADSLTFRFRPLTIHPKMPKFIRNRVSCNRPFPEESQSSHSAAKIHQRRILSSPMPEPEVPRV